MLNSRKLALMLRSFSKREWRWFIASCLVALVALLWLLGNLNQYFSVNIAASGGSLTEGIVGSPRFINPLLAVSDADRDLTALIYSGLMRTGEDSQPEPDLAEKVEISEDGLTYTFTLKDNLTWHDGESLTTDDIEFTILNAQDPLIKSSKRANWDGVKVEKVDAKTIVFQLKQVYPSFLENATIGILPKHIWGLLDSEVFALNQFNTESIGSGPYKIKKITRDAVGIPEYYDLEPFNNFALGEAKISNLRLRFYPSETELLNAYRRGEIEAASTISADSAKALEALGARVLRTPLPRIFGVFFNQNRAPVLANAEVREALELVIDREAVIQSALKGYGLPATGPLPDFSIATSTASSTIQSEIQTEKLEAAKDLLTKKGWTWDEAARIWQKKTKTETVTLQFAISTSDTPELKEAATLIRDTWTKLGAKVEVKVFEIGDLNQNVIRPRQYEALFFGEILGRNPDPYAFWHSSQRLDPGLNIALYTNSTVDKLLEEARRESDQDELAELYEKFVEEVKTDNPAIFVYAPEFLYLIPNKVKNAVLPTINTVADRFLTIHRWHINTDRVWPIFANKNNLLK